MLLAIIVVVVLLFVIGSFLPGWLRGRRAGYGNRGIGGVGASGKDQRARVETWQELDHSSSMGQQGPGPGASH